MFEGSCSDLSSLPSRSMAPYYEVNAVDRTQGLPFFFVGILVVFLGPVGKHWYNMDLLLEILESFSWGFPREEKSLEFFRLSVFAPFCESTT